MANAGKLQAKLHMSSLKPAALYADARAELAFSLVRLNFVF